jgi:hypothetical protein
MPLLIILNYLSIYYVAIWFLILLFKGSCKCSCNNRKKWEIFLNFLRKNFENIEKKKSNVISRCVTPNHVTSRDFTVHHAWNQVRSRKITWCTVISRDCDNITVSAVRKIGKSYQIESFGLNYIKEKWVIKEKIFKNNPSS